MPVVQGWREVVKVGALPRIRLERIACRLEFDGGSAFGLLARNPPQHLCPKIDITASGVRRHAATIAEAVVAWLTIDGLKRIT
jgi:hypothetical protein